MKKLVLTSLVTLFAWTLNASQCGLYIFGGGGTSSSYNIQVADTVPINGTPTSYDATLVASNLNGTANAGLGYNLTSLVVCVFDKMKIRTLLPFPAYEKHSPVSSSPCAGHFQD